MPLFCFYCTIANYRYSIWQESERAVTKKEGIEFAREYGCLFLECSAKTKVNVEQCFEELVLKVCHF
jgi:GTPase SAR1 family protein